MLQTVAACLHESCMVKNTLFVWRSAVLCCAVQGNVFTFLQQSGGRLPESVVVPMILEPTMSALNYIHELVSVEAVP